MWFRTHSGDYFNKDKTSLAEVFQNSSGSLGIDEGDSKWYIYFDMKPVSKGYDTEEAARHALVQFMTAQYPHPHYFMEN